MDTKRIRLLRNRVLVQHIAEASINGIIVPNDTHGTQGLVLNVAEGERSPLCANIYPGDTALIMEGAPHEYVEPTVFIFDARYIWGVIRDGVPIAINGRVLVKLDEELPDVDGETGIWTPEEGRDFPDAGTTVIYGSEVRVRYNVKASQRRFKVGGCVYVIVGEDGIVGVEG